MALTRVSRKVGIARYDRAGEHFEILVDPDLALEYRLGKQISIDKIVITDTVYRDAKKGLRASESSLLKVFKTTDFKKISEIILKEGEIPLTADQRRKLVEQKKRQIVEWICRNCIDVRTRSPVPHQRVENALERINVNIDPFKSVDEQIGGVLKELQKFLPIKVAIASIEVKSPPDYAYKVRGYLMKLGKIVKERYEGDGSLVLVVEVPAGLQDAVISKVNEITHNQAEVRVLS